MKEHKTSIAFCFITQWIPLYTCANLTAMHCHTPLSLFLIHMQFRWMVNPQALLYVWNTVCCHSSTAASPWQQYWHVYSFQHNEFDPPFTSKIFQFFYNHLPSWWTMVNKYFYHYFLSLSSTHQMTSQENTLLGIFQQAVIMLEVTVISQE